MSEEWRDIKGYEGKYQVSNLGGVRSLNYSRPGNVRIMKQSINKYGYYIVGIRKSNAQKTLIVHRLVAIAFIENKENKPCVNHINELKTDNSTCNLEWCTVKENTNHGTAIARRSKYSINGKCSKKIIQRNIDGSFVKLWPSMMEAHRNGYNQGNISNCCRGKIKTSYGYKWAFAT